MAQPASSIRCHAGPEPFADSSNLRANGLVASVNALCGSILACRYCVARRVAGAAEFPSMRTPPFPSRPFEGFADLAALSHTHLHEIHEIEEGRRGEGCSPCAIGWRHPSSSGQSQVPGSELRADSRKAPWSEMECSELEERRCSECGDSPFPVERESEKGGPTRRVRRRKFEGMFARPTFVLAGVLAASTSATPVQTGRWLKVV